VNPHMSIPVAFAFDFKKIITLPNCGFVPGNFAKTGAAPLSGGVEFDKMQFELVYHDSALSQEKMAEVHNWRMSEAVVSGTLSLSHLSFVICRTVTRNEHFGTRLEIKSHLKLSWSKKVRFLCEEGCLLTKSIGHPIY
jgi:hypothetical protein